MLGRLLTLESAAEVLQLAPSTLTAAGARSGRIRCCHELRLPDSVSGRALPLAYFRPREILADCSAVRGSAY